MKDACVCVFSEKHQMARLSGEDILVLLENCVSEAEESDDEHVYCLQTTPAEERINQIIEDTQLRDRDSSNEDKQDASLEEIDASEEDDPTYLPGDTSLEESDEHEDDGTVNQTDNTSTINHHAEITAEITADSTVENDTHPERGRGRKRTRNPGRWKDNVRKSKLARGEEYVSRSGKTVPASRIGSPCKCRKNCFQLLGDDHIKNLYKEFKEIGNREMQDAHLFGLMHSHEKSRSRVRSGQRGENYRKSSYKYYVKQSNGNMQEVCRRAFQSIHAIGKSRFERLKKVNETVNPLDQRGKHGKQRKTDEKLKEQIREHISSFPKRTSHYSRNDNPNIHYLHENLNVRRMWLLYLVKHEPEHIEQIRRREKCTAKVRLWLYRHLFNTEFNLKFGMPRSDTCAKCDRLELSINETVDTTKKTELASEKEIHLRKAESAYKELKQCGDRAKTSEDLDVYTFDFQQNLPIPAISSSDMFYSRMLWVYNFGLHDCTTGDGIMHLWNETTAKRGSSEVCSCLLQTVRERHTMAEKLVLFSDGCSGQNKNKTVISTLAQMTKKADAPYKQIDHHFLVRGHTFLPNDRDFALIEKRKKGESPVLPEEYNTIISDARTVQPFIVKTMKREDFIDYKEESDKLMKTSLKDNDGEKVKIRDVMWYSYGQSQIKDPTNDHESTIQHEDEVWCRYSHNPYEPWKKVKIYKRGCAPTVCETTVKTKYSGPIPLKGPKYNDLLKLCEKGLVEAAARDFYK
ncbi:MAG: hypothetical protein ABW185_27190, partial [Sedimenticola sp.]